MATVRGTIVVDVETCKGCELCIEACPQESLTLSKEINKQGYHYAVLVKDNCTGCVNCALVCPEAVITVYRTRKVSKTSGDDSSTTLRVDGPVGTRRETVAVITNVSRDITVTIDDVPEGKVDL